MNAMSLPQTGDEIGITFKKETFRAHLTARVIKWTKKEITINRLPSEIVEVIPLKTIKEITVLSQAA